MLRTFVLIAVGLILAMQMNVHAANRGMLLHGRHMSQNVHSAGSCCSTKKEPLVTNPIYRPGADRIKVVNPIYHPSADTIKITRL